jgi:hypothetical protein
MLSTALSYLRSGLCVLPARLDHKRPALGAWREYIGRLPTEAELVSWFASDRPLCIVAGAVSGNVEMIDFDFGAQVFPEWADLVRQAAPGLLERLTIERSQSGGRHVVYRAPAAVSGNDKLAQRTIACEGPDDITLAGKLFKPRRSGDCWAVTITLIETRGEGGLFLCAPTPGYVLEQGSLEALPTLTAAEWSVLESAARSLNEASSPAPSPSPLTLPIAGEGRPGDDFNARGDVREVLRRHGWELVRAGENEHWKRPGKKHGWSATLKGGVFYVFSSNASPFEEGKHYTPFGVFAALEHDGDFAAAAASLRALGYGAPSDEAPVDLSGFKANGQAGGYHVAEAAAEDDEPVPVGPADPGPLPLALLPNDEGFLGMYIRHACATAMRPQPVLALGAAIALLGTVTGRKVRDEVGTRTNIYVLGVCPSGGGKERARQLNKELLFAAGGDTLIGPEGLASHAGLITAVEQKPAHLMQLDEVGRLLKTLGNPGEAPHLYGIVTNLLKLFTSSSSLYVGDAYADSKRNKLIHQPHACLYGTTVPKSLYEGFNSDNVTDGFLSRVMVFEADDDLPELQDPAIAEAPAVLVGIVKAWVERPGGNLATVNPDPVEVKPSVEARDAFKKLNAEADSLRREIGEPLGTLWTRAAEKARKLAMIHACARAVPPETIDEAAALWGCELSRHLTRRLIYLAGQWVAENPYDARRKRILRAIREAGPDGLTGTQLCWKTRALAPRDRDEAVKALVESREVTRQIEQTKTKPRIRYVARIK